MDKSEFFPGLVDNPDLFLERGAGIDTYPHQLVERHNSGPEWAGTDDSFSTGTVHRQFLH